MVRRVITSGDAMAAAPVGAEAVKAAAPAPTAVAKPDDYTTRLLKYIPAEIVAAFLAISAIFNEADVAEVVPWVVFGVLLVMTPFYLWRVTRDPEKPLAMSQLVVGTIAFAIWVFALGGPFAELGWYEPIYGPILLIVYTLAIPIFIGR